MARRVGVGRSRESGVALGESGRGGVGTRGGTEGVCVGVGSGGGVVAYDCDEISVSVAPADVGFKI